MLSVIITFTIPLSAGVTLWEVQRCDWMWGKSAPVYPLSRSMNPWAPFYNRHVVLISRWTLTPGTLWLQRDRPSTVCPFLERAPGWRKYPDLVHTVKEKRCFLKHVVFIVFKSCSKVFLDSCTAMPAWARWKWSLRPRTHQPDKNGAMKKMKTWTQHRTSFFLVSVKVTWGWASH